MIELEEAIKYINESSNDSKVYIGCDSEVIRIKKGNSHKIRYTTVIVVHIDGSHGAKVFATFDTEHVSKNERYKLDTKLRLMNEVYKVSQLYMELSENVLKDIEVHLDLNPDERYLSNKVVQQAVGYVKGVCGVNAKLKPDAWAASACADRWHSVAFK